MRASGVLMHISSLPSKYGIGTMGQTAYNFVDFLAEAKQINERRAAENEAAVEEDFEEASEETEEEEETKEKEGKEPEKESEEVQKEETEKAAPEQDAEQEVWDACVQKEDGDDE